MIKGLYAAASAMIAGIARQRALAHNAANLTTPGFKQILVHLEDYMQVPVYSASRGLLGTQTLTQLGELGLGVQAAEESNDFETGGLLYTGEPLDLAIEGDSFFRVLTPEGERYTRDGRFTVDAEYQLVTVDGYLVLDENGNPIEMPEGFPSVSVTGEISVDGETVATIGLASFESPETELVRDLPNTFLAEGGATGTEIGQIRQGCIESSNVNPAQLMTQMIAVTRAYEAAQQLVQVQDELLGRTIATLGRF